MNEAFGDDLLGIDAELLDDDIFDSFFDGFICHKMGCWSGGWVGFGECFRDAIPEWQQLIPNFLRMRKDKRNPRSHHCASARSKETL